MSLEDLWREASKMGGVHLFRAIGGGSCLATIAWRSESGNRIEADGHGNDPASALRFAIDDAQRVRTKTQAPLLIMPVMASYPTKELQDAYLRGLSHAHTALADYFEKTSKE